MSGNLNPEPLAFKARNYTPITQRTKQLRQLTGITHKVNTLETYASIQTKWPPRTSQQTLYQNSQTRNSRNDTHKQKMHNNRHPSSHTELQNIPKH